MSGDILPSLDRLAASLLIVTDDWVTGVAAGRGERLDRKGWAAFRVLVVSRFNGDHQSGGSEAALIQGDSGYFWGGVRAWTMFSKRPTMRTYRGDEVVAG